MDINIGVVITTYNRLEKLKIALKSYSEQYYTPRCVIVINNASTDGTRIFLDSWKEINDKFDKVVIHLGANSGGSGGFFVGEEYAMKREDISWILIADDDAYPEKDYLEGLCNFLLSQNQNEFSIVCGKVLERNSPVNIHRTFLKTKWSRNFQVYANEEYYKQELFHPDYVSYVGILINKLKLKEVGLVNKDYFIWYDDTEHAERLRQVGKIVCLPKYSIRHDVEFSSDELSWKNYYGYRNNVDFMRRHFKLQFPFIVALTLIKSIMCPLKGKSITEVVLRIRAIVNGLFGNLGKHSVYKPGWKA